MSMQDFICRWQSWCADRGASWPPPLLLEEGDYLVARWLSERVSLVITRIDDSPRTEAQAAFDWLSSESRKNWRALAFCDPVDIEHACQRVHNELESCIPW